MLQFEALTADARELAPALCASLTGTDFVFAGGTGLALQLGHRVSADFHWFCRPDTFPPGLPQSLSALGRPMTMIQERTATVECLIGTMRCAVLGFCPAFGPPRERLHGLPVAPIKDTGAHHDDT